MARVDNFSVIDRKLYFSFVDIFLIDCGCVTTQAVEQTQKLAGEVETQSYTIVRPLVILLYISTSTANKYSHLHGKNKHQKHVACNVWSLQLLCSVS